MIRQAIMLTPLSLAIAACRTKEHPLSGTSWTLKPRPPQITIDFAGPDNAASGWTVCNRYSGTYGADEQTIDLAGMLWAQALCSTREKFYAKSEFLGTVIKWGKCGKESIAGALSMRILSIRHA